MINAGVITASKAPGGVLNAVISPKSLATAVQQTITPHSTTFTPSTLFRPFPATLKTKLREVCRE